MSTVFKCKNHFYHFAFTSKLTDFLILCTWCDKISLDIFDIKYDKSMDENSINKSIRARIREEEKKFNKKNSVTELRWCALFLTADIRSNKGFGWISIYSGLLTKSACDRFFDKHKVWENGSPIIRVPSLWTLLNVEH